MVKSRPSPGNGENSNTWFTEAIHLFETNNIGWAWWPLKKLGNNNPPLQLEMRMTPTVNGKKVFSVWLRNAKESIELKRTGIKIYAANDRKVEGAK